MVKMRPSDPEKIPLGAMEALGTKGKTGRFK